jgi:hypothetical protein
MWHRLPFGATRHVSVSSLVVIGDCIKVGALPLMIAKYRFGIFIFFVPGGLAALVKHSRKLDVLAG